MKTILIGNSLTRGLEDPMWEIVCLPGADWYDIIGYVISRKERFSNSFLYILVGPVRFTLMHKTEGRRECVLKETYIGSPNSIFRGWLGRMKRCNIIPILCTVYPADFVIYNNCIKKERLLMESMYKDWNERIKGMSVVENRKIVSFNLALGMATPHIHKRIFHCRKRVYQFRKIYLRDGLHPTETICNEWKVEFKRVNNINITAYRRQREYYSTR